jgi:hypothetical protein
MIALLEPVAVGVMVSLWSSLWSKYILPAICATANAQCNGEEVFSTSRTGRNTKAQHKSSKFQNRQVRHLPPAAQDLAEPAEGRCAVRPPRRIGQTGGGRREEKSTQPDPPEVQTQGLCLPRSCGGLEGCACNVAKGKIDEYGGGVVNCRS